MWAELAAMMLWTFPANLAKVAKTRVPWEMKDPANCPNLPHYSDHWTQLKIIIIIKK